MTEERGTEYTMHPTERAQVRFGLSLLEATATVIEGPDIGKSFIVGPEPLRCGKARDCDFVLGDPSVSNHHLELELVGSSVRLRDLGSTNGTYIGGTRIIESLVPPGSILQLGRTRIHLIGEDSSLVIEPSTSSRFGELHGKSVSMRQLYAVLERVSGRDVTVLLDGETGTGKELAARAMHDHSGRKRGPFAVFDCSAVAPELIESQLFGHARGSFTGANTDRAGVFESASGGTVFLDELDSLPLVLQPKLLRVLEGRRIVRLGEFRERPIDVRIIAASGRSPEEAASTGRLRKDLYFRLAVVRVTLPSLRDRVDDIPLLVGVLVERIGGAGIVIEDGPAMEKLQRHAWLGNVRELRNVLERGLALAPPSAARLDDLPIQLSAVVSRGDEVTGRVERLHEGLTYKDAKERVVGRWERDYLRRAFARCERNLSRTARELDLSRPHLRKLLRHHGILESEPTVDGSVR